LIPGSWALGLFYVWGAVAVVSLGRVALGLWQIRCLRLNSSALEIRSIDLTLRESLEASCTRPISLLVSRSVRVPMATGFLRPMIVIPEWAVRELSIDDLKVVLLHEAAHLQRRDDWTNLMQKVLRAVFFFHPVVWWLDGKLALEREMACDDMVLAATSSPRAYAECLLSLAEKSLGRRRLALAQAAVNRLRDTSLRIRQILAGNRTTATAVWKPAVGFAALAAMTCLWFVNEAPKVVGFSSPASEVQRSEVQRIVPVVGQTSHPGKTLVSRSKTPAPPSALAKVTASKHVTLAPTRVLVASKTETASTFPTQVPARISTDAEETRVVDGSYRDVAYAAQETVFVVVQDQQINAAGDNVVRFNVYRLTVFYPEFYPINPQKTLSKSI
jgi:hypothetical protein